MSKGLSPEILHKVLLESRAADVKGKARDTGSTWVEIGSSEDATGLPKVVYEVNGDSDHFEPRLRLIVSSAGDELVAFPVIPSPEEDTDEESQYAHITELQSDDTIEENHMRASSSSRGRSADTELAPVPRHHSVSPEHIST